MRDISTVNGIDTMRIEGEENRTNDGIANKIDETNDFKVL